MFIHRYLYAVNVSFNVFREAVRGYGSAPIGLPCGIWQVLVGYLLTSSVSVLGFGNAFMILVLRRQCYRETRRQSPTRTLMPPHADQLLQERILKTAQKLW